VSGGNSTMVRGKQVQRRHLGHAAVTHLGGGKVLSWRAASEGGPYNGEEGGIVVTGIRGKVWRGLQC